MKYRQIILLALGALHFSVSAEMGIGSEQATQSFRNSLSPQHKMQNLLGSPKFDAIGTQTDADDEPLLDESEPAPRPQTKRIAPPVETVESAVSRVKLGEKQDFTGKLVKAEWQKSTESYCQGGSSYYALIVKNERYIINSLRDPVFENKHEDFDKLQAQLAQLEGQTITLQGQTASRHFTQAEQCPNPMMQCMAGEITCDWLRVTDITTK
jgi:hypothetical protein